MLSIDPLGEEQPLPGMTMADFCRGWTPTLVDFFVGLTRNALSARGMKSRFWVVAFCDLYVAAARRLGVFLLAVNGGDSIVGPMVARCAR